MEARKTVHQDLLETFYDFGYDLHASSPNLCHRLFSIDPLWSLPFPLLLILTVIPVFICCYGFFEWGIFGVGAFGELIYW